MEQDIKRKPLERSESERQVMSQSNEERRFAQFGRICHKPLSPPFSGHGQQVEQGPFTQEFHYGEYWICSPGNIALTDSGLNFTVIHR